jgi:hypothetical protein
MKMLAVIPGVNLREIEVTGGLRLEDFIAESEARARPR